jgi:succinyl-CoA--D-citramalate CoA-transferase
MSDQLDRETGKGDGPLSGMLVLDLGNGAAGPFASTLLADFGADVVKVERPGDGDVMRTWDYAGGVWWKSMSRGKRSIAVDLSTAAGREIARDLIVKADVIVESFRPGVLERLGLGPDVISAWNPNAILLRVSGYGQTGPYRDRPGYGKAAEAFAGLLHMTGFPDGPPVYVGFPIADMCSGLMGAFGVLLAWIARQRGMTNGQVIDLALYESVLRVMDYLVPIASGSAVPLNRNGNRQPMSFAPSGIFRCKDERWVLYSAASPEIVRRVLTVVAGAEYANESRFSSLATIRNHVDEIDGLVADYCSQHTGEEVVRNFTDAEAVAALVCTPAEVVSDPHILARRSIVPMDGEEAMFVNALPMLSKTPGKIRFLGAMSVGSNGIHVLRDVLGYDEAMIRRAVDSGAVQIPSPDGKDGD